jgi:hypothetical protein
MALDGRRTISFGSSVATFGARSIGRVNRVTHGDAVRSLCRATRNGPRSPSRRDLATSLGDAAIERLGGPCVSAQAAMWVLPTARGLVAVAPSGPNA